MQRREVMIITVLAIFVVAGTIGYVAVNRSQSSPSLLERNASQSPVGDQEWQLHYFEEIGLELKAPAYAQVSDNEGVITIQSVNADGEDYQLYIVVNDNSTLTIPEAQRQDVRIGDRVVSVFTVNEGDDNKALTEQIVDTISFVN